MAEKRIENKRKWVEISENVKNVAKLQARSHFLKKCLKYQTVPSTLKVNPPKNQHQFQVRTNKNKFINVANLASIQNLQIALSDAKQMAKEAELKHKNILENIVTNVTSNSQKVLASIEKLRSNLIEQHTIHYNKRLDHLKMKHNIPIDNPKIPQITKKHQKSRRFIPRQKYPKWKKREAAKRNLDLVHNFSDFEINEPTRLLLNRGLSFVPMPKTLNITQTMADLDKYGRKLKWSEFFFEKEENEDPDHIPNVFRPEKYNLPSTKPPQSLNTYLGALYSDILGSCKKPKSCKDNLSADERAAIKDLIHAQSSGVIQIKPVDKGGGLAIMNTSDYLKEMSSQLNAIFVHEGKRDYKCDSCEKDSKCDTCTKDFKCDSCNKDHECESCGKSTSRFYVEVEQKALLEQKKNIEKLIEKGFQLNIISESDKNFMKPSGKSNRLYGLPKVHKGIKEGRNIPPCRPIVSNSGSNTENISAFVDHHSNHLVKQLESYVEDSPDFLRLIEKENQSGPQTPNTFPVTIDVTSLYTNIPINGECGGIQAFKEALNSRCFEEQKLAPTNYLLELLDLVLNGNIFDFNGKLYKQKIGTSMGTKVAPTYACIFMGWLEKKFLKEKWSGTMPHMWKRYIDDIFFLWHGSVEELESFINDLNQYHDHIKFTAEYDSKTKTIPFLDMQVTIDENGYIQTDLFKKETARCQYLLPSSCHPGHITNNIPFSLSYRLLRICSNPADFAKRLEELRQDLLSRNYHPKIIDDAFEKIKKITRIDALEKVQKNKERKTPLITTYHPAMPPISTIMKKHWKVMIEDDPKMKRFHPNPPIVAYKRSKNLRDMLIRAKINTKRKSQRKINGFFRCGRKFFKMCILCANIPTEGFKSHNCNKTKKTYKINMPVTCTTESVIYKISCKRCVDFVYIGETKRQFCERFADHRGYVKRKELEQVCGKHFNLKNHKYEDMIPTIIEQVRPTNDEALRLRREKYWINQYQSFEFGANRRS